MKSPLSKKAFREFLNREDREHRARGFAMHSHNQFHQRKRDYGDYLYFQDREKFEVDYAEWLLGFASVRLAPSAASVLHFGTRLGDYVDQACASRLSVTVRTRAVVVTGTKDDLRRLATNVGSVDCGSCTPRARTAARDASYRISAVVGLRP